MSRVVPMYHMHACTLCAARITCAVTSQVAQWLRSRPTISRAASERHAACCGRRLYQAARPHVRGATHALCGAAASGGAGHGSHGSPAGTA